MNNEQIRHFAITGNGKGSFPLAVTLLNGDTYGLIIGSSNLDLNPSASNLRGKRTPRPVSERTPNLTDMRVLRHLNPEVNKSAIMFEADETIESDDSIPLIHYRTTAEFLHDLENCNNDIGRMLSSVDNFRLKQ